MAKTNEKLVAQIHDLEKKYLESEYICMVRDSKEIKQFTPTLRQIPRIIDKSGSVAISKSLEKEKIIIEKFARQIEE